MLISEALGFGSLGFPVFIDLLLVSLVTEKVWLSELGSVQFAVKLTQWHARWLWVCRTGLLIAQLQVWRLGTTVENE